MKNKKLVLAVLISVIPVIGRADIVPLTNPASVWVKYFATLSPVVTTAHELGHAVVWSLLLPGSVNSIKVTPHMYTFPDGKSHEVFGVVDRNFDVLDGYQKSSPLYYKAAYSLGFLAGPAAGYGMCTLLRKIIKNKKVAGVKNKTIKLLLMSLVAYKAYLQFSQLIPDLDFGDHSDGAEIVNLWAGDSPVARKSTALFVSALTALNVGWDVMQMAEVCLKKDQDLN